MLGLDGHLELLGGLCCGLAQDWLRLEAHWRIALFQTTGEFRLVIVCRQGVSHFTLRKVKFAPFFWTISHLGGVGFRVSKEESFVTVERAVSHNSLTFTQKHIATIAV